MEWKNANEWLNDIKDSIQNDHRKIFAHLTKQEMRDHYLPAFRGDDRLDSFIEMVAQGIQHFSL